MLDAELKKRIKAIKLTRKKATSSKATARKFLIKAGIVDKSGKPTRAYR